jgi:UDP-2,3-diacylglucosamine hydrolase
LTHGDQLCADDQEYQVFRSMVRESSWQRDFLDQPLDVRKTQIEAYRSRSEQEKSYKDAAIMDVNADAVMTLLREHRYPALLIHGHTHRPARHRVEVDDHLCERIVLADWGDTGSYLACDVEHCMLMEFS